MARTMNKRKENLRKKLPAIDPPAEETLLIRQRLRNLCELAIAIGQKQGLLGNHKNNGVIDSKGWNDVSASANNQVHRDTQTTSVKSHDKDGES